jgi:uncharacterized protein (DUF952 family)
MAEIPFLVTFDPMLRARGATVKGSARSQSVNLPLRLDRCCRSRHHTPMQIYKILHAREWSTLRAQKQTAGAPIDVADGYIHFSGPDQVAQTAALHFAGADDLMLLALDGDALGADLEWESSRGGALFPHLYGPLKLADVEWAQPLPLVDDTHDFPAGLL